MIDGVGKYGGTLRTTILAAGDHYNLTRTVANETAGALEADWSEVIPSSPRSSRRARTRRPTRSAAQGLRWSRRPPFTADDIMFWYEDVFS